MPDKWEVKQVEAKQAWQHYLKYHNLALEIGVEDLRTQLPNLAQLPRTLQPLFDADRNLNNIRLVEWDRAATAQFPSLSNSPHCKTCTCYPQNRVTARNPYGLSFTGVWAKTRTLSLAERVCLLKHVAIYHVLATPPPPQVED